MGFFTKLFGGDDGIREAMNETYIKVKRQYPEFNEHEVLSLVLNYRYKALPPGIALIVSAIFPTIDKLTEWVVGQENSGLGRMTWPNPTFDRYLATTTTLEEREQAHDFLQDNMSDAIKNMM